MLKKIIIEFFTYLFCSLLAGLLLAITNQLIGIFQKRIPYSGMFYSPSWNNFMIELPTFIFYYLCQGLIFLFLVYFIKFQLSISIGIKQYILFGFLGGLLGLILGIGYALRDMKVLIEFLIRSISLSFIPGFVWLWTYNTLSKKIKNSV
jgi:hypothetical protein